MIHYSSERFFLYKQDPFRPMYHSGLGFQLPPSRTQLSGLAKRERNRWHIWYFIHKPTAQAVALSVSKGGERCFVAEASELRRLSPPPSAGAQSPVLPNPSPTLFAKNRPHRAKGKKLPRGLEHLA